MTPQKFAIGQLVDFDTRIEPTPRTKGPYQVLRRAAGGRRDEAARLPHQKPSGTVRAQRQRIRDRRGRIVAGSFPSGRPGRQAPSAQRLNPSMAFGTCSTHNDGRLTRPTPAKAHSLDGRHFWRTLALRRRRLAAQAEFYQRPNDSRSLFELVATVLLLGLTWLAMLTALQLHLYWLYGLLLLPAAGSSIRLFMIQHDCGHGALFGNAAANRWVGRVAGVFTLTPATTDLGAEPTPFIMPRQGILIDGGSGTSTP